MRPGLPRMSELIDVWVLPRGRRRYMAVALIGTLILGVTALVYLTGGIKFVYSHSMYVPIILAATLFGVTGGVAAGLVGGFALGPLMPLVVATGEMQDPENWLYRIGFFVLIGAFAWLAVRALLARTEHIKWLAYHDPATGLPNGTRLEHELAAQLEQAGENPGAFHLMAVAAANVAAITSTFGYRAEDRLVREVYFRLKTALPLTVRLFRYRPGRIAAIVPAGEDPEAYCRSSSEALGAPFEFDGLPIHVVPNIGLISCSDPESAPHDLIQKVDIALFHAREQGLQWSRYGEDIDHSSRENLALMGMLSLALKAGELRLHFQPKVNLRDGKAIGVEALLRWEHPEHGMIPPGRFIPPSENTDLINPITHWVLDTALGRLAAWKKAGLSPEMAVNISTRNLQDPGFADTVEELIDRHRLNNEEIELEITESAVMRDPEAAIKLLEHLKNRRIVLSIDDFGTGYSSLSYLSRLPIAAIKIDQAFVRNVDTDAGIRSIVTAAAAMGHSLGLTVIAEGIETPEALKIVGDLGCEIGQGYHICRPIPEQELLPWFRAAPWALATAPG